MQSLHLCYRRLDQRRKATRQKGDDKDDVEDQYNRIAEGRPLGALNVRARLVNYLYGGQEADKPLSTHVAKGLTRLGRLKSAQKKAPFNEWREDRKLDTVYRQYRPTSNSFYFGA